MSRYEIPLSAAEAVEDFRTANAAARQIRRRDGRTAATTHALARHQKVADRAMRYLLDTGEKSLAGQLTDEAGLIDRVAASSVERPELQQRLVLVRRIVRRRLQHLDSLRFTKAGA